MSTSFALIRTPVSSVYNGLHLNDGKVTAMVSIVENWADITGEVRSMAPATDLKGFLIATIQVEQVRPVVGFPNLLGDVVGTQLAVHIPETSAKALSLTPKKRIACWVRKADRQRVFAHPDHISVL